MHNFFTKIWQVVCFNYW